MKPYTFFFSFLVTMLSILEVKAVPQDGQDNALKVWLSRRQTVGSYLRKNSHTSTYNPAHLLLEVAAMSMIPS
jgi:hypothetical protein